MDPAIAQVLVAVYLTAVMAVMVAIGMIGGHAREKKAAEAKKAAK
jgi:hypothetical protein